MKRAWRVIFAVMLVALVLGAICIAVGILTGADYGRIFTVIDNRFNLQMYIDWCKAYYQVISQALLAP